MQRPLLASLAIGTLLLSGCTQVWSSAEQTSMPGDVNAQNQPSSQPEIYKVPGFISIDEDWAYMFEEPTSCDGNPGACISLTLQTPQSCELATINYQLRDIHGDLLSLQKDFELKVLSNFSVGQRVLTWKDPAWDRVQLDSIQCTSPEEDRLSNVREGLFAKLTVNPQFPNDFTPISNRIASKWKEPAGCKDFYEVCWSMFVYSVTDCGALSASFQISDELGNVLDPVVLGVRNLRTLARTSTAVQFGTPSKIALQRLEELRISVTSITCLDGPIKDESASAATISMVDLPDEYCVLGNCNPETAESAMNRLIEEIQKRSTGTSGGTGYRVRCKDGTSSNSGGKQGACSWHGGVSG